MEKIENGFVNEELGIKLNIFREDGREWFKAQDISEFLNYRMTSDMTRSLRINDEHIRRVKLKSSRGNTYEAIFLDENALYEVLLFVRKTDIERYEKARKLYTWIVNDIIPVLDLRTNIKLNRIFGKTK